MRDILIELDYLINNNTITRTDLEQTILYRIVQDESILDASNLGCSPKILTLVARIAATSDSLSIVNMANNNLDDYGPAIATALDSSNTIHTVNMANNNLFENGPATATALASSNTIRNV